MGILPVSARFILEKIPLSKQKILIQQSIDCGIETACSIKKYPFADVGEICEQMAVPIVSCESEQINERITFATYAEDEGIRLMTEPLEKLKCSGLASISKETAQALIIGHELFHHIEASVKGIYTQSEKLCCGGCLLYTSIKHSCIERDSSDEFFKRDESKRFFALCIRGSLTLAI